MATTILSHADDATTGLACGIGRTSDIANERAIAMYTERGMGIKHSDTDATAAAVAAIWADIHEGRLLLVSFGA